MRILTIRKEAMRETRKRLQETGARMQRVRATFVSRMILSPMLLLMLTESFLRNDNVY